MGVGDTRAKGPIISRFFVAISDTIKRVRVFRSCGAPYTFVICARGNECFIRASRACSQAAAGCRGVFGGGFLNSFPRCGIAGFLS